MAHSCDHRSPCPVVFALDLFGDRWTLLVIRDMVLKGSETYTEFLNSGEGIATNILADRLRRLEDQGIVTKHDDSEHGAKYRYRLTKKGLDLVPVIVEMIRWGAKHQSGTPVPKALRQRLDREPRKVADEFIRRARSR
ncbi:MAG: helix-turn-helix transcriptional regulator [bacterium]|nr:helix-turn-helix transcriptional regulator [bacterium]